MIYLVTVRSTVGEMDTHLFHNEGEVVMVITHVNSRIGENPDVLCLGYFLNGNSGIFSIPCFVKEYHDEYVLYETYGQIFEYYIMKKTIQKLL